ncbi:unnamed protein product [Kuraishia capsulata CBS 1993]|uniref:FAD/NAD(P)-binding domain-containing protein n=1 Tax=Kuraishia capsulata CBS 1993 TaxID=1382522 RepID=W6MT32_9ASCO|nr:uncharacterized protein KUCA_T00004354001 [Kuraishia capsulata CBS 1993]CDK28372.1 unnamed protein product [Kuraishia capsulata CBS 1993]
MLPLECEITKLISRRRPLIQYWYHSCLVFLPYFGKSFVKSKPKNAFIMAIAMKRIVIVGCGAYGTEAANSFSKNYQQYQVTVINNVDYYYMLPATVRNLTAPDPEEWIEKLTRPLSEKLNSRVKLIIDDVVDINSERVELANGSSVPFDALIIATGAHWNAPISPQLWGDRTIQGMKDYARMESDELAKAKDVAVVGGGFVGVELAGEIAHAYQDELLSGEKTLTIYHASSSFFSSHYGKKLKHGMEDSLLKLGVRIKYDCYVERSAESGAFIRSTNEVVVADKIYWTTGPRANTPPISIANLLNSKEEIKITETFQAAGHAKGNIFAIGDVTDYPRKAHMLTATFIPVIVPNVDSYLRGRPLTKKIPKAKKYATVAVSAGPEAASGHIAIPVFGYVMLPKFVMVRMKAKNLWTEQV